MRTLKRGSQGRDVQNLQLQLRALGYDVGDIDGKFGRRTEAAVREFQGDMDQLTVDGSVGPLTREALAQALMMADTPEDAEGIADEPDPQPIESGADPAELMCSDETWEQFRSVIDVVTEHPVVYGPGRGLWDDGGFVITYGPGGLGKKSWSSRTGKRGPSFHCSSWTNFIMGVLTRRNEDYTHAGNIPALQKLCLAPNEPVTQQGVGTWRGYGDVCRQIISDGSSRERTKVYDQGRALDLIEIWERRESFPTFLIVGQSTRKSNGKWRWWHHTVLYVVDHRQAGTPLYRIAADGYKSASGKWSVQPMQYREITYDDAEDDAKHRIYRGFCLELPREFDRPVPDVTLEP